MIGVDPYIWERDYLGPKNWEGGFPTGRFGIMILQLNFATPSVSYGSSECPCLQYIIYCSSLEYDLSGKSMDPGLTY